MACFFWLLQRPLASLEQARGLYRPEVGREERLFRWTSSRVQIPLARSSTTTLLRLELAAEPWEGRHTSVVTLTTHAHTLGSFVVPAPRRFYTVLVPDAAQTLFLQTNVGQPPGRPWHWVGVQVLSLEAQPLGWPWRALRTALLVALATPLVWLAGRWLLRRGYGPLALVTLLALGLRAIWLDHAPPGAHHDELVSLVDAWYLLHTGHDHHGNGWPLGAFEAFGDWISPLLTYLFLPAVALAGGPLPLAGRWVTVLVGTLAVPLSYGLAREFGWPRIAALACAVVTALAPWQVSLSRTAIPPALVFTTLTLFMWVGLRFMRTATPQAAWLLALVAGLGLYAYPTLKMFIPLLLGLIVLLAWLRHGWGLVRYAAAPAGLLALLWLPFVYTTLFNRASATRLQDLALRAETPLGLLLSWWQNYSLYWGPGYYYRFGDAFADHGYLQNGVQLWPEAPLVALGLVALLVGTAGELRVRWQRWHGSAAPAPSGALLLLFGALLLAPLPTSLTWQNPHAYRAAGIAPFYTLLVGLGMASFWHLSERARTQGLRQRLRWGVTGLLTLLLCWQATLWFQGYTQRYPLVAGGEWLYQDGLLETMRYADEHAHTVDAIWFDRPIANYPHIYLLAALPAPLDDPATQLRLAPEAMPYYVVDAVGDYAFRSLGKLTFDLPTREAILDRFGRPAYVLQEWQDEDRLVLLIRAYP